MAHLYQALTNPFSLSPTLTKSGLPSTSSVFPRLCSSRGEYQDTFDPKFDIALMAALSFLVGAAVSGYFYSPPCTLSLIVLLSKNNKT